MEYNGTTTLKADPPTRFGFLWGLITTNNIQQPLLREWVHSRRRNEHHLRLLFTYVRPELPRTCSHNNYHDTS